MEDRLETIESINEFLVSQNVTKNHKVIIALNDNKSDALLDVLVVNHPVHFLRQLPEYLKQIKLPLDDLDISVIGSISDSLNLYEFNEIKTISPYSYFKKDDDKNTEGTIVV